MKKNVLFLIESLSGGGAEKVLSVLLQNIDRSRFDVTLCCVADCGKYVEDVKPFVHYTYILSPPKTASMYQRAVSWVKYKFIYHWLPLEWVYRCFIPHHADVEIAFVEGFATKLLAHSNNRKAQKIAWVHIDFKHFHWTKKVYGTLEEEQAVYGKYDKVVTVSKTAESAFKSVFNRLPVSVQTLYNPIDCDEILKKSKEGSMLPYKKTIRLVSVGRLAFPKSYIRLLRIALQLKKDGYSFELWILGDGEERGMLQRFIDENQLNDRVTLWGFRANPYVYMAQSDLYICSSVSEGYSTAVSEALIVGLPVVTTDCSGMNELLNNGEYGIIVENKEEALCRSIKQLLDTPELLLLYKEKIKNRRSFSLETLIKPIEDLLAV